MKAHRTRLRVLLLGASALILSTGVLFTCQSRSLPYGRAWPTWMGGAVLVALFPIVYTLRLWRLRQQLAGARLFRLSVDEIPAKPEHTYIGEGFVWGPQQNRLLTELSAGGLELDAEADQHLVECQFRCSNGRFSGVAEIYLNHDDLPRIAEALEGFPQTASDSRDFALADGGVRLHCYCKDSLGHAVIEVKLGGDACKSLGEPESVALSLPIEAAGVDAFLTQVRAIDTQQIGASAFLPMAPL